jgi:choline dehydrogenase-like flavoprotein
MVGDERWYRWLPDIAEEAVFSDIAAAVDAFVSMDTEPGRAATDWLKHESLANHPSTVTWLLVQDGRVEGYHAMCSAEITLTERHRRQLVEADRTHRLHPRQGASLIAWIAKHREANIPGELLALHAVWVAMEVAQLQGNIALAVDPFDEDTAEFWQDRYGFRAASGADRGQSNRPLRLWLPLHPRD